MNAFANLSRPISIIASNEFIPVSRKCTNDNQQLFTSSAFRKSLSLVNPHQSSTNTIRCQSEPIETMNVIKQKENYSKYIRPFTQRNFCINYREFLIREWRPNDRLECAKLIGSILNDYGLEWDPLSADRDVMHVEEAYESGEFWVVVNPITSEIVGTAAYYQVPHRGKSAVEIRKMYLKPQVRGIGLGSFLLSTLEERILQVGYDTAFVETASCLREACQLYKSKGYESASGIETLRCDIVLQKTLYPYDRKSAPALLEVVDITRGWSVMGANRDLVDKNNLLFRVAVVLVETGDKLVVHKRSMKKSTYPGRISAVVTGCVDWTETPLIAAKREVEEELGLSNLHFSEPFEPFVMEERGPANLKIRFHPFIARGEFSESDINFNIDEIESFDLMSRSSINEKGIGGSLWAKFRSNGM